MQSVDQVLVHADEDEEPLALTQRWQNAHSLPMLRMGIGAMGTWVRDGGDNGFRVPNSPIYQARYLENRLDTLLYESDPFSRPGIVFVYRWRDQVMSYPSPAHDLDQPYHHTYGLISHDGTLRLALGVVNGMFSGEQRVFAFTAGVEPAPLTAWPILFGWAVVGLLAFGTSRANHFLMMMRRYFSAHGFYREAVREGRELMLQINSLILVSLSMAIGILGSVLLESVRREESFILFVRWLPEVARITLVALLDRPLAMMFLLGSGFAVAVTFWTTVLSVISTQSRRRLLPGQVFTLVLWPRWPVLLLMVAAMVVSTIPHESRLVLVAILLGAAIVVNLMASTRTLLDYVAITRGGTIQQVLAIALNPFLVPLIAALLFAGQYAAKVQFLMHLLFRP